MAKTEEKTYFELPEEWEVINARELEWGTFFTLKMPGLMLFDLRVVPEGRKYDAFIGMPEEKGKDGNYYKRFALYLKDEDTKAILKAVEAALDEKPAKKRK